jgi:hypothetical protein
VELDEYKMNTGPIHWNYAKSPHICTLLAKNSFALCTWLCWFTKESRSELHPCLEFRLNVNAPTVMVQIARDAIIGRIVEA